jgi:WD40 repeat protein
MQRKYVLKAQILVCILLLSYGCTPGSEPANIGLNSTLGTTTSVPSVISTSTAENLIPVQIIRGHTKRILDVAFTAQGRYLASSSQDMSIQLWDVGSGEEVHTFRMTSVDMADIDISQSRNLLASAEAIWDLETYQEIHVLERGLIYPGSVAFSPDGSILALGLFEKRITIWDVTSGQPLTRFDRQEENRTKNMDFSPDGASLAVGVIDGTVRIYDVSSGEILKVLKYSGETDIHDLSFSPDGKYLASGGRVPAVILWEVASGEVIRKFRLTDNALSMDFSPDGTMLATTGGIEYEVLLWDVESGDLIHSLPHNDQLSSLAFSPDGRILAVGCFNGNIYLWEIPADT